MGCPKERKAVIHLSTFTPLQIAHSVKVGELTKPPFHLCSITPLGVYLQGWKVQDGGTLMEKRNLFKRDSRRNRRAAAWIKRMLPMSVLDAKAWLTALPAVRDLVFANAWAAGLIEHDKATGLWVGTATGRRDGGQA